MDRTETATLTNMCMIYDNHGNVLVEEKNDGLIFPGGHVEYGESIVDSMIREVKEETGLTISGLHLCGIKNWIEQNGSRYIVFLYKTNEYSGQLQSSDEGYVFWTPLSELKRSKHLLWHLELMLDIFCDNLYSELYFDSSNSNQKTPVVK